MYRETLNSPNRGLLSSTHVPVISRTAYHMAGNIGRELNWVHWRMNKKTAKFKSANAKIVSGQRNAIAHEHNHVDVDSYMYYNYYASLAAGATPAWGRRGSTRQLATMRLTHMCGHAYA